MTALEFVGEAFVVDAQKVQDSSLEIVDVNFVLDGVEAELVAPAVTHAGLHTAARHPQRECVGMMIAAPLLRLLNLALQKRRAPKFAAPNDERVVEQSALLEVAHQRG